MTNLTVIESNLVNELDEYFNKIEAACKDVFGFHKIYFFARLITIGLKNGKYNLVLMILNKLHLKVIGQDDSAGIIDGTGTLIEFCYLARRILKGHIDFHSCKLKDDTVRDFGPQKQ